MGSAGRGRSDEAFSTEEMKRCSRRESVSRASASASKVPHTLYLPPPELPAFAPSLSSSESSSCCFDLQRQFELEAKVRCCSWKARRLYERANGE